MPNMTQTSLNGNTYYKQRLYSWNISAKSLPCISITINRGVFEFAFSDLYGNKITNDNKKHTPLQVNARTNLAFWTKVKELLVFFWAIYFKDLYCQLKDRSLLHVFRAFFEKTFDSFKPSSVTPYIILKSYLRLQLLPN